MSEDIYFNPTVFTKISVFYIEMAIAHSDWKEDKIIEKTRKWAFKKFGFEAQKTLNAVFYPMFIHKQNMCKQEG